jgi:N-hydroxyarylamine O-acetyltransferase
MSGTEQFDLDAYLRRIGGPGAPRADLATLRSLHLAHVRAIPFENLDALRREPPSLDIGDITAKLVDSRRGGYCYEHNLLFEHVLRTLGFRVTRLAARVVAGADADAYERRPRTHMALLVGVPGDPRPYLADVGFGPGTLREPAPLADGAEFRHGVRLNRLVRLPHEGPLEQWSYQEHSGGDGGTWTDQYLFTLEPFERSDYEVFNWYVGAHPRSPFTRRVYAHRSAADRDLLLDGALLTETHADGTVKERRLLSEREARRVLDEEFGIAVPEGTALPM